MSNNLRDNFEEREIRKNDNVTDSERVEDEKNCYIETCNENVVVEVGDEQNASFEEQKKFVNEEDGQSMIKPRACGQLVSDVSLPLSLDVFTSKVEHNVNYSTAEVVEEPGIEEDNVSNDESVPDLTNKLKLDELLILFSWLPLDDLVTVRRVCHIWRVAAQDKSLWRNRVLNVSYGRKYLTKIKLMPYIENIKGRGDNTLLDTILENVIKLKKLNVEFCSEKFDRGISPFKVELILQRYPELESITLYATDPDILENLEVLKSSSHLKEVKFYSRCMDVDEEPIERNSNFMYIFTDISNFPALTSINLPDDCLFRYAMNKPHFRNILYNIIKTRSQQLSLLKLVPEVSESPRILDAISQCVKLQKLYINLGEGNGNLNIEKMTQLRSLFLWAWYQDLNFFTILKDSLYKGFWSKLTKINIKVNIAVNIGLLRAIVDNAKSLKSLTYEHRGYYISDDELENINTLVNLEGLVLGGFQNITEEGICYITKCHKLKNIELWSAYLDISFNSNCIKDMLLQLNNLQSFIISNLKDEDANLFLENREEIEIYVAFVEPQYC